MNGQRLFIGLGNPGNKYANNRHNFGFMALDEIASSLKASAWAAKFGGLFTKVKIKSDEVMLFKPLSFMNNSGVPAAQIVSFYKIAIDNVHVFYDELDVALGKIKIKQDGGDGGHNGIKSLDSHIGKDYWRVRLGIGHPGHKDLVHSHVLSDFSADEKIVAEKCVKNIAANVEYLVQGDANLFLTRYHEAFV